MSYDASSTVLITALCTHCCCRSPHSQRGSLAVWLVQSVGPGWVNCRRSVHVSRWANSFLHALLYPCLCCVLFCFAASVFVLQGLCPACMSGLWHIHHVALSCGITRRNSCHVISCHDMLPRPCCLDRYLQVSNGPLCPFLSLLLLLLLLLQC